MLNPPLSSPSTLAEIFQRMCLGWGTKKMKFKPPPLAPWGAILSFFSEIFRRRSVRLLKLHRGFILTKKGDINTQKNSETPPLPPGGAFLGFFEVFF